MKKSILILIVVALVLALTSCSQEVYSQLGDIMGQMGNNVYGIKANMAQVEAATESLNNSVQTDESGNVTVNLTEAAKIIDSVADIKESAQKTEALKEELAKPLAETAEEKAAIQTALQAEVTNVVSALPSTTDIDSNANLSEGQKQLLKDVVEAVSSVTISENPTKAELATVAVLSEIAKTAQDVATIAADDTKSFVTESGLTEEGQAIAETALSSLDTLKVVSEVANVDILGDLDLVSLLSSFRSVSRESSLEISKYMGMVQVTASKILGLITDNNGFNADKYASFISQCKALKSCYDLAAAPYTSGAKTIADFDSILKTNVDHGFTIEDLAFYAVISAFVEADKVASAPVQAIISEFIKNNSESLANLSTATELTSVSETAINNLVGAVFTYIQKPYDESTAAETLKQAAFEGKLAGDVSKMIGTATVILVDAEYQSILGLVSKEGTISGIIAELSK